MALTVKEFVIKASFKDEQSLQEDKVQLSEGSLQALKAEILNECMEKVEAYLEKKGGR